MTRAFVTGIGGQDGSYLAEQLIADGVEVHALAHVEEGLRRLLLDLAPDEIYNLAAISSVAQSWELPDLTSLVNGSAAVALLETAHRVQERTGRAVRMVQASSAEIFGEPDRVPQDEDTRIRPLNPYGAAKAYTHLMVDVYRTRDLHASAVILYNHESPRRPPRFVTRKITSTVAAIASGAADTLTLGNLDVRRDWGWAPDYADAMVRAARAEQAQDFVIATGRAHSVRDFVAAAFDHVGITDWESLVTTDPGLVRPADASEMVGDASRAHRELGWQPTVGFAELFGRMVQADLDAQP
jgi:GDPmannose 4,6-dehydratase